MKLINSFANLTKLNNEIQRNQKIYSVPTWLYSNTLRNTSYNLTNY